MAQEIILANMRRPTVNKKGATEKVCKRCPEKGIQPIDNFCRQATNLDGRSNVCKKCSNKRRNAHTAKMKDDCIR